jgi:hypothetical protein
MNYNKEEYKKNSMKKGHSNNKYQESVHKSCISQARELQDYYDNMKSIREQREYQEPSMNLHMAKKYQDSMTYDKNSRGGCKLKEYKEVTTDGFASSKGRSRYKTEEPVLRQVSWKSLIMIQKMKLSSTVTESRIIKEVKRRKIWI